MSMKSIFILSHFTSGITNGIRGARLVKSLSFAILLFVPLMVMSNMGYAQVTFSYTGSVETWTVPAGVTSIIVTAQGAIGGLNSDEITYPDRPGYGARVRATMAVTPGQVLSIYVGGQGSDGNTLAGGSGGYNGGGAGGYNGAGSIAGGGGGGATDIRLGGNALTDRILVAAGGGGAGAICNIPDGDRGGDGGLNGEDGADDCSTTFPGHGGTTSGPGIGYLGSGDGALGVGGDGYFSSGGGGGAGLYGGSGSFSVGGGGGSSYTDPTMTSVTVDAGFNTTGNGLLVITLPNSAPSFTGGTTQTLSVCQNSTSNDITSKVAITEVDTNQLETWMVMTLPSNGSISYTTDTITSTGSTINPTGWIYTPTTGFAGNDTFVLMVDDGHGASATSTVYVTVNALPALSTPTNQSICHGTSTDDVVFGGTIIGQTYSWTNDNTSTGLAASGITDTIHSFVGTDTSLTSATNSVIVVTPYSNGCAGAAQTFTITVNPIPNAGTTANYSVCNANVDSFNFNGSVAGTTYTWTNSNTTTGIAASGTGNIPAYTATNTTSFPALSIIDVTPATSSCTGAVQTFTVTVNPTPDVASVLSQTKCNGFPTDTVTFNSSVDGASYTWNNDNTSIGLANSGTGNIYPVTTTNTTPNPITGNITVVPAANGCFGPSQTFSITVNPTPLLSGGRQYTICDSSIFHYVLESATAGTVFSWTRDVVSGISNAAGSGADTINEALNNTTNDTMVVVYVNTLNANGCTNFENVRVTVNPTPVLSSLLATGSICDSTEFTYLPASTTNPTPAFTWNRNFVVGLTNPSASGSGNVDEYLHDTSLSPVVVTYDYTLTLPGGCSNTQSFSFTVNPTPKLNSNLTPASICDSSLFHYIGTSGTPGATITWSRDVVSGIANASSTGVDSVNEYLDNTSLAPVTVTYIDTISIGGCWNTQAVTVAVNPSARLTSLTNLGAICDSQFVHYGPTANVSGTTFTWSRPAITGIAGSASGVDSVNEMLVNNTDTQIVVIYVDTLNVFGCKSTEKVSVTVSPNPKLSSPLTAAAICDSATFNYTPTSNTPGATFIWDRPYVPGIALPAASGTGNPNEELINTTYFNVTDIYEYTITAYGCVNHQNVAVVVHPTPTLSSSLTATICSGVQFNYTPTSFTPAVTYTWSRLGVSGISPVTNTGTGNVSETLTNSTVNPVTTAYNFTLNVSGCKHYQNLALTVEPNPTAGLIGIMPPHDLCNGTFFQNFGAASAPANGAKYSWSATNAFVWAESDNKQNCLVSFSNPGTAVITLNTTAANTSCRNTTSYTVNVGNSVSDQPVVIYYNKQFICLQTNEDHYQWGYDDLTTLDSTLIPGEINPNYFNSQPDFNHLSYWVMTNHNGCFQKTYFNIPTGVTNVNEGNGVNLKLYPNPATDIINIEINSSITGNVQVNVMNLVGQNISTVDMSNHSANLDISSLPAGVYLVDCIQNGVKIANSKFVKN